MKPKSFTIHGHKRNEGDWISPNWVDKTAIVFCFDPTNNEWKQKESTCRPHLGSSLLVVNNRLHVVGGRISCFEDHLCHIPAPVLMYNEKKHLVFSGTKRYFPKQAWCSGGLSLINKFPVDSGIRIPPGGRYPVPLSE